MQNFDLLKEVGKAKKPVMLKRGLSATIKEFLLAAEYILAQGNQNVILCERGIRTFEDETRNTLCIATVPIGYADGLSRRLSNGKGKMIIKENSASIVGNVCMDMCMLDITNIQCAEGDEVIVFGSEYSAYEIAKDMDTIPYEVFTGISRRVKRVYFHE